MFHRVTLPAALGLLLSVVTCATAAAAGNEAVAATIESFITSGSAVLAGETDDQRLADIYLYYSDRDFKPIWTRDSGAKSKAKALLGVLKAAAEHGLDPDDYSIDEIEERLNSTDPGGTRRARSPDLGRVCRLWPRSRQGTHRSREHQFRDPRAAEGTRTLEPHRRRRGCRRHRALPLHRGACRLGVCRTEGRSRPLSGHCGGGRLADPAGGSDAEAGHERCARARSAQASVRHRRIFRRRRRPGHTL